jgi:hypothetical protein
MVEADSTQAQTMSRENDDESHVLPLYHRMIASSPTSAASTYMSQGVHDLKEGGSIPHRSDDAEDRWTAIP